MESIAVTVFGIAGLLALIGPLPTLAGRLGLPYTVLLAVFGCALGGLLGLQPGIAGVLGEFLEALAGGVRLPSEGFLILFLPVLLFETAVRIDLRDITADLGPILLLAVVAVLVTAAVAGVAVAAVSSLGLAAACLLAATVATTDPAAVVAVFREMGAPRRLVTLVEGESLLNDAAAVLLFTLLIGVAGGTATPGIGGGALTFLQSFVGGALFGGVFGRLAASLSERLGGVRVAEVTLSVALPYLAYYLAEHHMHVSGVVAVVAAGLAFGSAVRVLGHPAAWTTLDVVWTQLGFWASSLIFVLVAMRAPEFLGGLRPSDLAGLAALIVGATAARAAVLYGLLPPLALLGLGQRIENRYKLTILWGGLRGAVTFALVLAVVENPAIDAETTRQIAGLATGFVLFTLFVQAPTLRGLIRSVGLDRLSPTDRAVRGRAFEIASADIADRLSDAAAAYRIEPEQAAEIEERYRRDPPAAAEARGGKDGEDAVDRLSVGLVALAGHELALVRRDRAYGMVSPRLAARLARQAQALLDAARTGGRASYRATAAAQISFGRLFRVHVELHRRLGVSRPLARLLADRFELLTVRAKILRDLKAYNRGRLKPLIGDAARVLKGDLDERLEAVEVAIESLNLQYPAYGRLLAARSLERAALRLEEAAYRDMYEESLIGAEVMRDLKADLRRRRAATEGGAELDLDMDVVALIRRVPLFEPLNDAQVERVARLLRPRLAFPGERLIQKGARGDSVFFIASGAVEVGVEPEPVRLGTGAFVGELALLTRQPRSADVTALGYGRLLTLDGRAFRRFLRDEPSLRERILAVARARMSGETVPRELLAAAGE